MGKMRLDKFISNMTKLSRSEAVERIYHNHVRVGGKFKKDPALKINPEKDEIFLDNDKIEYEEFVYYVLNKPSGVVSATEDKPSAPGRLEIITPSSAHVTIHEGKSHQIKRMFLVYGLKVTYLKRIAMGNLTLGDDLALGEYRKIKREDIIALTQF